MSAGMIRNSNPDSDPDSNPNFNPNCLTLHSVETQERLTQPIQQLRRLPLYMLLNKLKKLS